MGDYVWGNTKTQFFFNLTPETILNAIENTGFKVTGRCLSLNSMENRVFEVEIDIDDKDVHVPSDRFLVAKFYRPGRWTKEQILDEHNFLLDLKDNEIPVIAPLQINNETLFTDKETNLYYCLFPKRGGRIPQEMSDEQLEITGRLLARIHNVGSIKKAEHRIILNPTSFGRNNLKFILDQKIIPTHLESSYQDLVEEICEIGEPLFKKTEQIRIHGDCHWGNLIVRDEEISFIDFDDMLMGPPVQDIWLVTPGKDAENTRQRNILLAAYETMRDFDNSSLKLVEVLRAFRYIHFSAWIAKRWDDPSFKNAFAHFEDQNYWEVQTNDLRVQLRDIKTITSPYPLY